jgi:hypothetical protein
LADTALHQIAFAGHPPSEVAEMTGNRADCVVIT